MKQLVILACAILALPCLAVGQTTPGIPTAITTPDKVESRLGPLEFKDGAPNAATVAKIYDNLDYTHAFNAFNNTMRGMRLNAFHSSV
jgi:hypothetical protein